MSGQGLVKDGWSMTESGSKKSKRKGKRERLGKRSKNEVKDAGCNSNGTGITLSLSAWVLSNTKLVPPPPLLPPLLLRYVKEFHTGGSFKTFFLHPSSFPLSSGLPEARK